MIVHIRTFGSVKILLNFFHINMQTFHYTVILLTLFQGTVYQQGECNVLPPKLNMQEFMNVVVVSLDEQ